ncbi:solute carrier family 52, riboflavin transporter, member 2 isoform X3 [Rhinatrema bivittatum]|uniref:solute carrier family 52, riboflavin transporter, member 2 isoform X3 n=1 Tax=Rhinatrema bivittatum TaxID=194408 RepID=UPI00112C2077|nr:solute carrier family 52, riboflavin transporter, member 2 isoform X3 [Rhinatrema bivittatum]
MIHGPCERRNSNSPCLVDGKCSKGFPKKFQNETATNEDGYPTYQRRNLEPVTLGKHRIDNSWVVPYNPYLSLRYNCHINIEICASVKSVKYLFKYVFKGNDWTNVNFKVEVQTCFDSRYVSSPEAIWRIFRFDKHQQSHPIMRLAVHLKGEQTVLYRPDLESVSRALQQHQDTTLTAWFNMNQENDAARVYKYTEIPEHFVFSQKDRKCLPRKAGFGKTTGRMYPISIGDTKRYFLRLILLHVPGATCFEFLKPVNGVQYDTYFQAAKAQGLTTDENIWDDTLADAAGAAMPRNLRDLFAYICIYSGLTDMSSLWNNHKTSLIDDFVKKKKNGHFFSHECNLCESYALRDIQDVLMTHGKRCNGFSLQIPLADLLIQFNDGTNVQLIYLFILFNNFYIPTNVGNISSVYIKQNLATGFTIIA